MTEPDAVALAPWGWDDAWERQLDALELRAAGEPARVVSQERDRWMVQSRAGLLVARLANVSASMPYPVVGDWVVITPGPMPADPHSLLGVLPRRSAFARGAAGRGTAEQVLAANVDTVWIVHGLDTPPNLRRLERYLAVAWESGAVPEVVLTKADLVDSPGPAIAGVSASAAGVRVHVVSVHDAASVDALRATLAPGRTVALLGPSGAGKSTLVNRLAGQELAATGEVRATDHKGRHTTTRRALFQVPGGALLLDTPGLRELRIWDLGEGLASAFPDVDALAAACRFRDCAHEAEPGCAVRQAVADGQLDEDRLTSFRKLRAEAESEARRSDPLARAAAVARHKMALKTLKAHPKYRDRG